MTRRPPPMPRLALTLLPIVLGIALASPSQAQSIQLSPPDYAGLEGALEKLAKRYGEAAWCSNECTTFLSVRFSGLLSSGRIDFEFNGEVHAEARAMVRLFSTAPAVAVDSVLVGGRRLPLYWYNGAYSVVLPPGSFRVSGSFKFVAGSTVTLKVPGPAGLVSFAVQDAETVGSGARRGVVDATYRLTPVVAPADVEGQPKQRDRLHSPLRLVVERSFFLARDKQFVVQVRARGAKPGQLIRVPLHEHEQVETYDERIATPHLDGTDRRIDWVISATDAVLVYRGKWTGAQIDLRAPDRGATETWRVSCNDPYRCAFTGDAENQPGTKAHVWKPLPGQGLRVEWLELEPAQGATIVAQDMHLHSRVDGRHLKQSLSVAWRASAGALVAVKPPAGALIEGISLDQEAQPILKNKDGFVQLSLPHGSSTLRMTWQIADAGGYAISTPMPSFAQPVGTLWHSIDVPDKRVVVLAGGLAGSPRVALWPNLAACLLVGLVFVVLARRANVGVSSQALWLITCAGFALHGPAETLALVVALATGRWLGKIQRARSRLRIVLELAVWAVLVLVAISWSIELLNSALFSSQPFEVNSFVVREGNSATSEQMRWAVDLGGVTQAGDALPGVWTLTVSLLSIRVIWAAWAIVHAIFLLREGRLGLQFLTDYWRTADWRTPPPKKRKTPPLAEGAAVASSAEPPQPLENPGK